MSDNSSQNKCPEALERPILMGQNGLIKRSAVEKSRCKIFFYYIYQLVPEANPEYEVDSDENIVTSMK